MISAMNDEPEMIKKKNNYLSFKENKTARNKFARVTLRDITIVYAYAWVKLINLDNACRDS